MGRTKTMKGLSVTVKGIKMSNKEYRAFVDYLNRNRVQHFTRSDVERFLNFYHDEMLGDKVG